ncbi:MAG: hypothetical protein K0R63_18 [Rickettsiales bacterium]|jgi:sec-independent protein translocase protein TatA|nr:hypothetical protein [Rickettsiales bacterium]
MNIGVTELLLILVVVFVIFGAGKLPAVMKDLGKGIRQLREGMSENKDKNDDKKDQQ